MSMAKRDNLIDILRGLAIVSIVETHAAWVLPKSGFEIAEFGLTFNVLSFLFVAGFLFSGISDSKALYSHVGKRIVKLWFLYFAYSVVMLVLNPFLVHFGVLADVDKAWVQKGFFESLIMQSSQRLIYPMWFVPMFIFASCMFAAIFAFSQKRKHSLFWHCAFALGCAVAGFYSYRIEYYPQYYVNASLLCVPVMYAGYLAGRAKGGMTRYITWWGTLIATAVVLIVVFQDLGSIDLSSQHIISPLLFYPVAFAGIYMALGFSRLLSKVPYISSALACCGRNSFHIMALHLLAFKLIDFVWGKLNGFAPSVYQAFPAAFDFWYIYVVLGTALSLAVAELGKWLISCFKSRDLVHQFF